MTVYRVGLIILLVLACICKFTYNDAGFWILWGIAVVWWIFNRIGFTYISD